MRIQWSRRRVGALAVLAAAALGAAAARGISAQGPPGPVVKTVPCEPLVSIEGKDSYTAYCAVCHGMDGRGNGPAAVALKPPVPDLTTLAERQGGRYNDTAVVNLLTGRGRVPPAHGSVAMPVWGPIFRSTEADHARATLRIKNLTDYIGSLQKPGKASD
jgi:mono/diheme cytochrome c family protein